MNLYNHLRFSIYLDDYGEEITRIIEENNLNSHYWNSEFKKLYQKAWQKLDNLIKEHEAWSFLKAVRVFDPNQLDRVSKDPKDYENVIPYLDFSQNVIKNQFIAYTKTKNFKDESQELIEFWKGLTNNCPELAKVAIRSLNMPVTSVDVERSFSMYRDILSHKRCSLKLDSISSLSMINYNSNIDNS